MPLRPQQHLFRGVLFRTILFPLVLMLIVAGVFVWQIGRLIENTRYVEQADRTISDLNRLERLHIDLETGLRGFLLAGDAAFLEPFNSARGQIEQRYDGLAGRVDGDAGGELASARAELRGWLAYADRQLAARAAGSDAWRGPLVNGEGKRVMDSLRGRFARLLDGQESARSAQNLRVQATAQTVVLSVSGIALAAGLILAFAARGQMRWLSRTYERALVQAHELSATLERRVEERTAEVTRSHAHLAEANKELEAFAYSVSHDLRAPMRHITGFSSLLQMSVGPGLSPDDRENLDTIHATAVLAGRMVDDLLAFSRVGRTAMRQDAVDMAKLVRRAIDDVEPETRGRAVEWAVAELPPAVGDASLLRLVWQNLVGNAVKYTAKGDRPARIDIGVCDAVPPGGDVGGDVVGDVGGAAAAAAGEAYGPTYFIRDNGVGFDMAYAHKLFGVFQRLHRAEDFEGTGIGLANVRRIIVRHDGQVWADGHLGKGATFYFRLPARTLPAADADADDGAASKGPRELTAERKEAAAR